jgi:hypothetical protein
MRGFRRCAALLLACLAGSPVAADEQLTAFDIYHRPAEELAAIIQPLLGPFEAVIPNRNQLIVKASPEKTEEIRALLDQLDKSPHRLLITVVQGSNLSLESLDAGGQVQGRIGPDGTGVRLGGHAYRLEGRAAGGDAQQVQTLDGSAASIQIGSQIPVPAPGYYGYGGGIDYRPVTTGFSVTPRLLGDQVLLELDPWSERASRGQGGAVSIQSVHTQVKAALGEWVEVGGQTETTALQQGGFSGSTYATRSRENRTFLKVEDLDAGKP